MVFHKTAIDVLAKGLDPKHPHKTLGTDGMLIGQPSHKKEEDPTGAVFSITGSEWGVGPNPYPDVKLAATDQTEEKVTTQQTTESVIPKTGRRPPVRTPKVPQE